MKYCKMLYAKQQFCFPVYRSDKVCLIPSVNVLSIQLH